GPGVARARPALAAGVRPRRPAWPGTARGLVAARRETGVAAHPRTQPRATAHRKWSPRRMNQEAGAKLVEIHTDGACLGNPGPGGWAALLCFRGREKEIAGGEPLTTNNRMELMAAIMAL